jgi:hypothetical protein
MNQQLEYTDGENSGIGNLPLVEAWQYSQLDV